jgi:hypothetical protein
LGDLGEATNLPEAQSGRTGCRHKKLT